MMHRTFYGDESGSISQSNHFECKYFIIGMISTSEKKKVKRVFRKSKIDYLKHHNLKLDVKSEIKGSEMPIEMKTHIFEQLIKKTDIEFYYTIVDNHYLDDRLRSNPHVTYNYLVGIFFKDNFKRNLNSICLMLDERNKSVKKLKDLQNYLETELYAETCIDNIEVQYVNSENNDLVQVADVFNNLIYSYATRYMNAKKPYPLTIKAKYLDLFSVLNERIICITNFPSYKSEYINPH
ncbi:DUF3800 domain-containing protein [Staphylococcus simulans]|uniref:DUF3800 domain-containing protein n=1 Tax=Staphylococcus simulans TaxID=1286 RepID=UPI000D1D16E3|nr:DUF3800 domain-containing protein [Staphylococcus simulans]PTJ23289.1 hypothetical protein BU039_05765 [Staphylococcus simulans]